MSHAKHSHRLPHIVIYTDGACKGNPGPGGWGVVLRSGNHEKQLHGGEKHTTNNRMEMSAVIFALKALKQPSSGQTLNMFKRELQSGSRAGNNEAGRRQPSHRSKMPIYGKNWTL